jgi:2',3'-cyclic-nucleotide 2'-phosphodiesterase/3'-nucleotidase/5'-nucleotidase
MPGSSGLPLWSLVAALAMTGAASAGSERPVAPHLVLQPIGSYREAAPGSPGACRTRLTEIAAYDPASRRLFTTNAADAALDVLDIADPRTPTLLRRVRLGAYGLPTSVAAAEGVIAVAMERVGAAATEPGSVVLLDARGRVLQALEVGVSPDMVTFTPDGRKLLVANEGEPSQDYRIDPEGSIGIVDLGHGPGAATVSTAGFGRFQADALRRRGIRIFGPNATAAEDLEPEYIAVAPDSRTAWVTLQENNALAVVDVERARVTSVVGLGTKRHGRPGYGLDASDEDGRVRIRPWPVRGLYQPDAIAAYATAGGTYLVTVNDGSSRQQDGFDEVVRVGDLTLDPTRFPHAAWLQRDANLGRLQVSRIGADPDGDGDVDRLLAFGARSFSIRRTDGRLLHDSGDALERLTARDAVYAPAPNLFNTPDDENSFDGRSDARGPEPAGLTVGRIGNRTYAFVALRRPSVIATFDVTDPDRPRFQHLASTRDFTQDPRAAGEEDTDRVVNCAAGDLGPEGILFIPARQSPIGKDLLVVAFETSGSTRVFRIVRPRRAE